MPDVIDKPRIPWDKLFGRPLGRKFTFRKGIEFTGRTHRFLTTLRNHAHSSGIGLTVIVSPDETEITVFTRKKGPRGRKLGGRNGQR